MLYSLSGYERVNKAKFSYILRACDEVEVRDCSHSGKEVTGGERAITTGLRLLYQAHLSTLGVLIRHHSVLQLRLTVEHWECLR